MTEQAWKVAEFVGSRIIVEAGAEGARYIVAENIRSDADANIMAAAPKMLALLEAVAPAASIRTRHAIRTVIAEARGLTTPRPADSNHAG